MQGKTGKALKKELVIESPQQFKYAPVVEEEQDGAGPQGKVSALNVSSSQSDQRCFSSLLKWEKSEWNNLINRIDLFFSQLFVLQ